MYLNSHPRSFYLRRRNVSVSDKLSGKNVSGEWKESRRTPLTCLLECSTSPSAVVFQSDPTVGSVVRIKWWLLECLTLVVGYNGAFVQLFVCVRHSGGNFLSVSVCVCYYACWHSDKHQACCDYHRTLFFYIVQSLHERGEKTTLTSIGYILILIRRRC